MKFNERLLVVSFVNGMPMLPVVEIVLKYFKASMPGALTAADMAKKLGFKMAQVEKLVMQGFLGSPNRRYGIHSRELSVTRFGFAYAVLGFSVKRTLACYDTAYPFSLELTGAVGRPPHLSHVSSKR